MNASLPAVLACLLFFSACVAPERVDTTDLDLQGFRWSKNRNIERIGGSLLLLEEGNMLLIGGVDATTQIDAPPEFFERSSGSWTIRNMQPFRLNEVVFQDNRQPVCWDANARKLWFYETTSDTWMASRVANAVVPGSSRSLLTFFHWPDEYLLLGDVSLPAIYNRITNEWRNLMDGSATYDAKAIITVGFFTPETMLFMAGNPVRLRAWNRGTGHLDSQTRVDFGIRRDRIKVTFVNSGLYLLTGEYTFNDQPVFSGSQLLKTDAFTHTLLPERQSGEFSNSVIITMSKPTAEATRYMVVSLSGGYSGGYRSASENGNKRVVEVYEPGKNNWVIKGYLPEFCQAAIQLSEFEMLLIMDRSRKTAILSVENW